MKAYFTYFKLKFISSLQYRLAAIAGISTQFFFGFIYIMVYIAFYKRDKKLTMDTLNKYRSFYHPTALKYIELDLKTFAKGEVFLTINPLLISSPCDGFGVSACSA